MTRFTGPVKVEHRQRHVSRTAPNQPLHLAGRAWRLSGKSGVVARPMFWNFMGIFPPFRSCGKLLEWIFPLDSGFFGIGFMSVSKRAAAH